MFNCVISSSITLVEFVMCILAALVLGVLNSLVFSFRGRSSGNWTRTLAMLPAIVCLIIMLVNGNIGAGLGVAGAFSLVRFRSIAGNSREILGIFASTALGLACGMGFLGIAALFFLLVALAQILLTVTNYGEAKGSCRRLRITIPENLEYDGLFDDIFEQYVSSHELVRVKTSNMGTLYELTYIIYLKSADVPKAFLDELRCRNGNLNIICGRVNESEKDTL